MTSLEKHLRRLGALANAQTPTRCVVYAAGYGRARIADDQAEILVDARCAIRALARIDEPAAYNEVWEALVECEANDDDQ